MQERNLGTILIWVMVGCLALAGLLWVNELTGTVWQLSGGLAVGAAFMSFGFSLLARFMVVAIDRGKAIRLMQVGLGFAGAAYLTWMTLMFWVPAQEMNNWFTWMCVALPLTGMTVWMAIVGMVMLIRIRHRWAAGVRTASLILLLATGATGVLGICHSEHHEMIGDVPELDEAAEAMGRLTGVIGILSVLGLLTVLAASNPLRASHETPPPSERRWFSAACPRCGLRQRMQTDGAACTQCGLKVKVSPT